MMRNQQITAAIMQKLLRIRRAYPDDLSCSNGHSQDCFSIHEQKIVSSIAAQRTLRFVLPAFPAKSPNPTKTATIMPDLGERLALNFLNQLCEEIHSIYSPGVEMIICSDGRVFNDLVNVSEGNVNAYSRGIQEILYQDHLTHLTLFSLDDYYYQSSYEHMREELMREFGEPIQILKERVKNQYKDKKLFNGIHRFIFEDQQDFFSGSKNTIRKHTKAIAYEVIRRSNAWSRFVEKHFQDAVRLSIHPQLCGSEKFGIMLLKSDDVWATPWHRVVIKQGTQHTLAKKAAALQYGAKPVFIDKTFSHYVLD